MDPDPDSDPDPDPAISVIDLQDANKKLVFLLLLHVNFSSFFKDKNSKRSQKAVRIKAFQIFFYLVIEGSGSGSRRPKNILIRIRIRNTDYKIKCCL
jgi:hypothetical protein